MLQISVIVIVNVCVELSMRYVVEKLI